MSDQKTAGDADKQDSLKPRSKSIYLLPNAFTIGSLFCGMYAIIMALGMEFKQATVLIFVSMLLDSMDGRVARLTHTSSAFGAELDSLADMVAFGVSPALVVYEWSLKYMDGRLGLVPAFVLAACAALRLARFNTNIGIVDKRYFQGLPSPAAAALVAGFIWLMEDLGVKGSSVCWYAWVITLYAGITMVTNVPFFSFKVMNFKKSVPFLALILVALILTAITFDPPTALFGIFCLYGLSGYVIFAYRKLTGQSVNIIKTEDDAHKSTE